MPRGRSSKEVWLGLGGLTLAGLLVRLFRIGHQSLWIDEILTLESITLPPGGWKHFLENPQGPLHAFLLLLWTEVAGRGEGSLRLLSAIPGACSIPVFYHLARRLAPGRAWLAAALLAFSPIHVWYSQEARGYALALFFLLVGTLALVRSPGEIRTNALHFTATALAALSNFTALFVVPAQALAARAWARGRRAAWLAFGGGMLLVLSPWLLAEAGHIGLVQGNPWPTGEAAVRGTVRPGPGEMGYLVFALLFGTTLGPSLTELRTESIGPLLLAHAPVLVLALVVAAPLLVLGARRAARAGDRGHLVLAWFAIPFLAVLFLSLFRFKAFTPRYVLLALPAALLLLVLGEESLSSASGNRRSVRVLFGALLLSLFALSLANLYFEPRYGREDSRSAARLVARSVSERDRVFLVGTWEPFRHYYVGSAPARPLWPADWSGGGERLEREVEEVRGNGGSVVLVRSRAWTVDPDAASVRFLEERWGPPIRESVPGVEILRFAP